MFVFFFFQAEDGIRDADVTGVQTCALPICARPTAAANGPRGQWLDQQCAPGRQRRSTVGLGVRRWPSRAASGPVPGSDSLRVRSLSPLKSSKIQVSAETGPWT